MKILVTYAVDPEFDPWKKARKFDLLPVGDYLIHQTKIGAAAVDFVVTGMGPAHASRALAAIDWSAYALCIASGLAGAVVPTVEVGGIIVPNRARQGKSNDLIAADSRLIDQAVSIGAKSVSEIVSWDRVATTAEEKYALTPYGDAVDMESYSVLAAAQERGVRSLVIRAISDRHDQALPVDLTKALDDRGQVSISGVLKLAAGNPMQLGALMRLGRESRAAAEALARFLQYFIEQVAGRGAELGIQAVARRRA
jgi:adenosylhomocysteine nucleosidase